jgi:O-antigen ligase
MAGASKISLQAFMGWEPSPSADASTHVRIRDLVPAIAAALLVVLAHFAYGAVQPAAALSLSALVIATAMASLFIAGPSVVSPAIAIAAVLFAILTLAGLVGPLHRAGPQLATLFAAGALFVLGLVAAQRRNVLDALWSTLIWASAAWCGWMFFAFVSTTRGDAAPALADAFATPANGALAFGMMAILGLSRILHILKQADSEALALSQLTDKLLREGVGGLLLLVGALTCLVLLGSLPGLYFVAAVLLAYGWWDTLSITRRPQHGIIARVLVIAAPIAVLALAALGVWQGWHTDDSLSPGLGLTETLPNLQRQQAYLASWLESPIVGHGLGTLPAESARFQTLANAKVMLAPGGPQNVALAWLVETGIVGLAALAIVIVSVHVRIFGALTARRASRTLPRMAVAAGGLLFLHGMTDSSLDIPAVTWLYALMIGVACGRAPSARRGTS